MTGIPKPDRVNLQYQDPIDGSLRGPSYIRQDLHDELVKKGREAAIREEHRRIRGHRKAMAEIIKEVHEIGQQNLAVAAGAGTYADRILDEVLGKRES